jgi:hypothetical protein
VVAFRSRLALCPPLASSVCCCCSARPAIYASVESVRCCGQLPRFKENQELRPERGEKERKRERERERDSISLRSFSRYLLVSPVG